jgi:hypothetical protein
MKEVSGVSEKGEDMDIGSWRMPSLLRQNSKQSVLMGMARPHLTSHTVSQCYTCHFFVLLS